MAKDTTIKAAEITTTAERALPRLVARPGWRIGKKARENIGKGIVIFILAMGAIVIMIPLYWQISTSLKSIPDILKYPPKWIPYPPLWKNYMDAVTQLRFLLYLKNTLLITLLTLIGVVLSSSLVAYGFARLRAPGLNLLFLLVLSTMMLPYQVTLIPTYILFGKLGWVNTFKPLIVPAFFGGGAFNIFLLRQFFMTIPLEYDDAARIDGCDFFGIYWRILLPLSAPALATVAIFHIMWSWNDFMGPLIYLHSMDKWTLSLALQQFNAMYARKPNLLMASSLLMTIPLILMFFFAQRLFIQGVVITGVKG